MTFEQFIRRNWKMLALSAAALAVATVCVFFPPAIIATGLASSSAFAVFGTAAVGVATAVVAGVAAAATVAAGFIGAGIVKAMSWLGNMFANRGKAPVSNRRFDDSSDSSDDEKSDSPDSDLSLRPFIPVAPPVGAGFVARTPAVDSSPTPLFRVTSVVAASGSASANPRHARLHLPSLVAPLPLASGRASPPGFAPYSSAPPSPNLAGLDAAISTAIQAQRATTAAASQPVSPSGYVADSDLMRSASPVAPAPGTPFIMTRSTPLGQTARVSANVDSRNPGFFVTLDRQQVDNAAAVRAQQEAGAGDEEKKSQAQSSI